MKSRGLIQQSAAGNFHSFPVVFKAARYRFTGLRLLEWIFAPLVWDALPVDTYRYVGTVFGALQCGNCAIAYTGIEKR